jgi:hypothetical protein
LLLQVRVQNTAHLLDGRGRRLAGSPD